MIVTKQQYHWIAGENLYQAIVKGNRFEAVYHNDEKVFVHSIFDKTVNLETKSGSLITLARRDVEEEPATLISSMPQNGSWHMAGLKNGSELSFIQDAIYLNESKIVGGISAATLWQPAGFSKLCLLPKRSHEEMWRRYKLAMEYMKNNSHICHFALFHVLEKLPQILNRRLLLKGNPFLEFFCEGILSLHDLMNIQTEKTSNIESSVIKLLGLGEGLTPSGDDFLAGVLCCISFLQMVYQQKYRALQWIANSVINNMEKRTNKISCHFLRHAAEGLWGNVTENLLCTLFLFDPEKPNALYNAIDRKLAQGASSGMDELIGIFFGLYEWLMNNKP